MMKYLIGLTLVLQAVVVLTAGGFIVGKVSLGYFLFTNSTFVSYKPFVKILATSLWKAFKVKINFKNRGKGDEFLIKLI